jgi:hypothetical protein
MKYILFLFFIPLILFSIETKNLDKELYEACENNMISNKGPTNTSEKIDKCNSLLSFKVYNENMNNKSFRFFLNDNTKQFHIGLTSEIYHIKVPRKSHYNEDFSIVVKYSFVSIFFESRLLPILYLGARLGTFSKISCCNDNLGIMFNPYIRFNPFYILKYFDLGLSLGITTYYLENNNKDILFTFNAYLGFRIANTIKINFELGTGQNNMFHIGCILGILF